MQTKIRKIGSSNGVIIPVDILTKSQLKGQVEINYKDDKIIITKSKQKLRLNWFANYNPKDDKGILDDMPNLATEEQDWQW